MATYGVVHKGSAQPLGQHNATKHCTIQTDEVLEFVAAFDVGCPKAFSLGAVTSVGSECDWEKEYKQSVVMAQVLTCARATGDVCPCH